VTGSALRFDGKEAADMFCSTIIPTVNRPTLARSVCSVLNQEFNHDNFEVIIVNDSGNPLPPEEWQQSARVKVISTNARERSVARNVGAAIAQGKYLHFLDDDDWMLSGALESFWQVSLTHKDAVLLFGSSQLIDRDEHLLCQLHHNWVGNKWAVPMLTGEWIAIEAYIIKAQTFFEIGGFNPHISTCEERDVCRRLALRGDFAGTSAVVSYHILGETNSTTDYGRLPADLLKSKELMLNEAGAFARLITSAQDSYWYGRIIRAYVASVFWNLKHKMPFTAASRTAHAIGGLVLAGPRLFSVKFWQAVSKPYVSKSYVYSDDVKYVH
jgi:glycosyltransferase involved in cell wall biosynthesis